MNIGRFKDTLLSFLNVRKEVESLEKAREDKLVQPDKRAEFREKKQSFSGHDELQSQMMGQHQPGVSVAGIETRRADARIPANKVISHGYGRTTDPASHKDRAIGQHTRILNYLKRLSTNLPKSELDKADQGKIKQYSNESGVNKPHALGSGISSQGYTVRGGMKTISPEGNKGQKFSHKDSAGPYDRELARDKAKKVLRDIESMPKPNLPKSEDGMKKSDESKHSDLNDAVDYDVHHPRLGNGRLKHRSTHMAYVEFSNEGRWVPPDSLTEGHKGQAKSDSKSKLTKASEKAKVEIQPNQVTEPIEQNRIQRTSPKQINGPVFLNTYKAEGDEHSKVKNIISALCKAKVDDKLPPADRNAERAKRNQKPYAPIKANPKDPVLSEYHQKGPAKPKDNK